MSGERNRGLRLLGRIIPWKLVIAAIIIACLAAGVIGAKEVLFQDNKTTRIGLEDIGELATQSAYCTEVNVTEASRELFGVEIPFTQSKYIYSYDVVIKAGYDFREIEVREKGNTVEVTLPEVKILSNEIDLDSFKVYYEKESIFRHITLTENNEAMSALTKTAEKDAIANGLFDEARRNAETILKGFLAGTYDPDEYEIVFTE